MAVPRPAVRRRLRRLRRELGRLLVRSGLAVGGPRAVESFGPTPAGTSWGGTPRRFALGAAPRGVGEEWPTPPVVDDPAAVVSSIYDTGDRPPSMDLALLEALNEEYRERPLVPEPLRYDDASREARAQRRLLDVHRTIDVADKRVLELGCGTGEGVWYLSHHFAADAWGVDVVERRAWDALADARTHFLCADLATDRSLEPASFDRIISFTVLEHVVHPWALLGELFRILKPGGLVYLSANLHRGPRASHVYREIYFPFPHLLFSDDVIREFRSKHHGQDEGSAWVNHLTWAQYEDYFREIGFVIRALRFRETPLDEGLYDRFSDVLGRYPRWDLTKDFFHVVLEKPKRGSHP